MKNVVAAVATALAFTACEQTPKAPPPPPMPKVVALTPSPVGMDSGVPLAKLETLPAPKDPLAIEHDTPNVDHLARSQQLLGEDQALGALTEARRALFSNPNSTEVLETIARVGRRAGQPEIAALAWERLAQERPSDAIPTIKQARAWLQAKRFSEAVAAGREASTRDPGNPEAFQVTGIAQLSSGDLPGAITSFKTVIALQSDHGYAMNNLGLAYLRANLNAEAVEILEQAAEQLPTVAYVHNNLGVAYERVGRKDEAKHAFQVSMDLSPKYVKARVNAARVAQTQVDADDEPVLEAPHPMSETPEQ